METVPVAFIDRLAETLKDRTLRTFADSFRNATWERTLQSHRENRRCMDVYLMKRPDGWTVWFRCFDEQRVMFVSYTWDEVRACDRRFARMRNLQLTSDHEDYYDEDDWFISTAELHKVFKCYRSNIYGGGFSVRNPDFINVEEYAVVLNLLADVPLTFSYFPFLNKHTHYFFSRQTAIRILRLKEVERPEDEEFLLKLIAMDSLEDCDVRCSRKLKFAIIKACVERWVTNENFYFSVVSHGRYSKKKIEKNLFVKDIGEPGDYYGLHLDGRTSSYVAVDIGSRNISRFFTMPPHCL
ncbi:hypothetical protein QR680_007769 [Steinernema hermaphroditum]|uniref:Uncharacterized protein n=1 Tax=Steinernema hermaphroditum TaxID=289476 RepID=A0AA39M6H4_9BILA|nr:hypothetical protein QR680_007769 [Steinernema hermaphroditum]